MAETKAGELAGRPLVLRTNTVPYLIAGGSLLPLFLGIPAESGAGHPPSQAWVASTVTSALGGGTEGLSRLAEEDGGYFLKDLLDASAEAFLGKAHAERWRSNPGYLIKLLNSRDRLLVQVHPDKARARKYFHSEFGKTEAWYVIAAERDARLYAGFRPGVTREVLRAAILGQDSPAILGLLHDFPVVPGDILFIPAGLPHALGKGSLVMEIQEPTDITLRAERRRPSGELLPENLLHSGLGMDVLLDCFDYEGLERGAAREKYFLKPVPVRAEGGFREDSLVGCGTTPCFAMNSVSVGSGSAYEKKNGAFVVALVLSGSGRLQGEGFSVPLARATELFIPAGVRAYRYEATADLKIIECHPPLPGGEEGEP